MKVDLREMKPEEAPLLRDFLLLAIYVPDGGEPPHLDIIEATPYLRCYCEGWGRLGDLAVVAESESKTIVGAAWLRQMTPDLPGYGFIDSRTRSLAIAVLPERRGEGIGTALLRKLFEACEGGAVSLSVAVGNPAARLYRKFGFETLEENEEEEIMVKHISSRG